MKLKNKELADEWFARAKSDFLYARAGEKETGQHHVTCFLCHQAVEKILKGILIGAGKEVPRTHNLRLLHNQIVPFFPKSKQYKESIARLDAAYIPSRYPGPIEGDFTTDDAQHALSLAEALMTLAGI
jgi:HEPN domain-containing protein